MNQEAFWIFNRKEDDFFFFNSRDFNPFSWFIPFASRNLKGSFIFFNHEFARIYTNFLFCNSCRFLKIRGSIKRAIQWTRKPFEYSTGRDTISFSLIVEISSHFRGLFRSLSEIWKGLLFFSTTNPHEFTRIFCSVIGVDSWRFVVP